MPKPSLLKTAEEYCRENKLRFTDARRDVLKIISGRSKPIGAYNVLEKLKKANPDAKPMTAYRALDFLQENHFIHRIESLNAYIACEAGHHHSGSQFMICTKCGSVSEAHTCHLPDAFEKQLKKNKFDLKFWNTEFHGLCAKCK
jgi:Fur family zinc uptake transcriptional regulator